MRLCSPALSASPALLQSVTGEFLLLPRRVRCYDTGRLPLHCTALRRVVGNLRTCLLHIPSISPYLSTLACVALSFRFYVPICNLSSLSVSTTPGMHTNAVDARRAMALVEQPDVADGGDGGNSYASPRAGATGRRGSDGSSPPAWEASKGAGVGGIGGGRPDDAAALVRRAKALGVPPLPPDLGAVRYVGEASCALCCAAGTRLLLMSSQPTRLCGGVVLLSKCCRV